MESKTVSGAKMLLGRLDTTLGTLLEIKKGEEELTPANQEKIMREIADVRTSVHLLKAAVASCPHGIGMEKEIERFCGKNIEVVSSQGSDLNYTMDHSKINFTLLDKADPRRRQLGVVSIDPFDETQTVFDKVNFIKKLQEMGFSE